MVFNFLSKKSRTIAVKKNQIRKNNKIFQGKNLEKKITLEFLPKKSIFCVPDNCPPPSRENKDFFMQRGEAIIKKFWVNFQVFYEGGPAIPTYPSGLGNWDIIRQKLNTEQEKYLWDDKLDVLYFRGSRTSPERDGIIKLSRKRRDDVDAFYVPNQSQKSMEALKEAGMGPVVLV